MLADYVFVDQWSIFDFLSMMPAERAKAFQRLFRTERAESLWKLIGEHHDSIVIPTPGIDKDAVIKRLTENKEKRENLRTYSEEIVRRTSAAGVPALQKNRDDYQRRQATEQATSTLRARIEALDIERQKQHAEIAKLAEENAALDDYLKANKADYTAARDGVTAWTYYASSEKNRLQLTNKLGQLSNEMAKLVSPAMPKNYFKWQDRNDPLVAMWYAEYDEVQHEIHQLSKLVEAIKSGVNVCNACGSAIPDASKHLPEHTERLYKLMGRKDILHTQLRQSQTYDQQREVYQRDFDHNEEQYAYTKAQLANLDEVPKPSKTREEFVAFIKQYDEMSSAFFETGNRLHQVEQQYHKQLGVIGQLRSDLATQEAVLAQLQHATKESADEATRILAEYEQLKTEKARVDAQLEVLSRQILDDAATQLQLEDIEEEAKATRAWSDYCSDMRHILHRDSLPRLVAQNYLELMEDEINNLLVRFGSSFSVQADESLSFMATFHDGRRVPAARLSGGEKVLLALAFRVAVNDIFAKDLGLLVLDEPTAGLDEGNLACLRIAVERLKELSAARGLQVIMITHERDLHNLFDHVIEMERANDGVQDQAKV
jgi:exonuclease SbcC